MITEQAHALLTFIAQHEPIQPFEAFSRFGGAGEDEKAFAVRPSKLGSRGLLVNSGKTGAAIWSTTALAKQALRQPRSWRGAVTQGPLVPPRQVNVMHGPVYAPAPAHPPRAGALDFLACPSIQLGQAVAYQPEVRRGTI